MEVIMSTTDVGSADASAGRADVKLEVVVIPVLDVDRAKEFYAGLGWRLDADLPFDNGFGVVQFTPPSSGASVQFGTRSPRPSRARRRACISSCPISRRRGTSSSPTAPT
jgi:catechol 2,3-dioxygenase-like lactoylglutathione lyase family enzyme